MSDNALAGWRVVITRAEEQSAGMAQRLRELGAEPLFYPTIAFALPDDTNAFDNALAQLGAGAFDWLVFTSANAVRFTHQRFGYTAFTQQQSIPSTVRVATVGPATAAACESLLHIKPDILPDTFIAEALAEALGDLSAQRVLLLNADLAKPTLEKRLSDAGAHVERVIAYRTVPASNGTDIVPLLHARRINAITFASGSAVRFFVQRIGTEALDDARGTTIVCIGPSTAEEARIVGLPPTVTATTSTEEGMIDALVDYAARTP